MGIKTGISWTQSTWNPWRGCHKVSAGCKNCYMFRDQKRYGNDPNVVVRSKTTFNDPIKWKVGRNVFPCSWSDWFIQEADKWRAEAWAIIKATPHHTYQICTKRIERAAECLPADWGEGYPNVWLGVTGENQEQYLARADKLLGIKARVHWVSIEPQIEEIDITTMGIGLDWFVVGGESGKDAREFNPDWARKIIQQAHRFDKAVFVKQMGSNPTGLILRHAHGANPAEWNKDLRVQEFPKV